MLPLHIDLRLQKILSTDGCRLLSFLSIYCHLLLLSSFGFFQCLLFALLIHQYWLCVLHSSFVVDSTLWYTYILLWWIIKLRKLPTFCVQLLANKWEKRKEKFKEKLISVLWTLWCSLLYIVSSFRALLNQLKIIEEHTNVYFKRWEIIL